MQSVKKIFLSSIFALILFLLSGLPAMAVVLPGTSWQIPLTFKVKFKGIGGAVDKEPCRIVFNQNGTCTLTNSDGSFNGTFTEDSKGKLAMRTSASMAEFENFLANTFSESLRLEHVTASDVWVNVNGSTDESKVKAGKNKLQLKIKQTITFTMGATIDGKAYQNTGKLTISGKKSVAYTRPDELRGTIWDFETVESGNLKKIGSYKEPWFLTLYFGPNEEKDLHEGEFLADNSFDSYRGTYSRSGNNGVIKAILFSGNWERLLANVIEDRLGDNGMDAENIVISLGSNKIHGKLKNEKITLEGQAVFSVGMVVDGEPQSTTGKFKLKGVGRRLPQ